MDTTETYIKMCEKAVEIQKLRKDWLEGDIYYDEEICYASIGCSGYDCGSFNDMSADGLVRIGYETWLPRQDQLQEILELDPSLWTGIVQLIWEFGKEMIRNKQERYIFSMEQLWLAFVMKEKYNKIWDGKDKKWKLLK